MELENRGDFFHRNRALAIAAALAAAALFGATTPAAKRLVGDVSPWLLAALLYLGSGLGLLTIALPVAWLRKGRGLGSLLVVPKGVEWVWLLGASLFGGMLAPVLLMFGLVGSPGGYASLFLNLEGVFTVLLAWFVFRETVDRRIALGMACIVVGGVLLGWKGEWQQGGGALAPVFLLVGACLAWAIDNNLSRKLSGQSPLFTVIFKSLTAGGTNLALAMVHESGNVFGSFSLWPFALVTGFLGYGVSLLLFMHSLRHLGTARTSAYFSMAPFVGALGSLLVLDESLGRWFWGAAALMATGVFMHVSEHHEHEHLHPDEEHTHVHAHDEHHQHPHAEGEAVESIHSGTHVHRHRHRSLRHSHPHFPDEHHLHTHRS